MGVTWYTWLGRAEMLSLQHRDGGSDKALQCTPTETRHLFVLAGLPPVKRATGDGLRGGSAGASPA